MSYLLVIVIIICTIEVILNGANTLALKKINEYLHYEQLHRRQAWLDENVKLMKDQAQEKGQSSS